MYNIAAELLLKNLFFYMLNGCQCYSEHILIEEEQYNRLCRLPEVKKLQDLYPKEGYKLPHKKTWQNWTQPDLKRSYLGPAGVYYILAVVQPLFTDSNIDTMEAFVNYYRGEIMIKKYANKKSAYKPKEIVEIKFWIKELMESGRFMKDDAADSFTGTTARSHPDLNKGQPTQPLELSLNKEHPADTYISHFFIDKQSAEYKTNLRVYLKKYLSNFESYIAPTELVGRLNGINRDGKKFIELFEYQIPDVKLIYHREEQEYKEYIPQIVSHGASSPFLITGDAGGGKTSLCYMIFQRVIRTYYLEQPNENKLIPLYIPMYMFKNVNDLRNPGFFATIYKDLAKGDVKEVVCSMIKQGKVLVILDGLDEIDYRLLQNLGHGSEKQDQNKGEGFQPVSILRDTYKGCPMIVTSRRHFYETYGESMKANKFEHLSIKPLNLLQIESYVTKRLSPEKSATALKLIERTDLIKLAPTVVLLEMIVTTIDKDQAIKFTHSKQITKKDIYKTLVEEWSKEQAIRIRKIVEASSLAEKSDMTMRFLMIVSLAMFYYGNDGILIISTEQIMNYMRLYHMGESRLAEYADDLSNIFSHLSFSKLNTSKEESYAFNHKTILEYLIAESILLGLKGDLKILTNDIKRGIFIMLSKRLDKQDDNEIINFIKDLVEEKTPQEREIIHYQLMDMIDASYEDQSTRDFTQQEQTTIRNNALKILAYINHMNLSANRQEMPQHFDKDAARYEQYIGLLAGKDFSEIKLDDCNLTDRNLSFSNLSSASLKGINLSGANLHGANFSGANLTGAYLGDCHSIWDIKYSKATGQLLMDRGDGHLILTPIQKQARISEESSVDRAVWTIGLANIDGYEYAIAGQYSDKIEIYNVTNGLHRISLPLFFSIKIYTVRYHEQLDVLFYAGSSGNIHYISDFSELLRQQDIDTYLAEPDNCKRHHLNFDLTDSYIKKDHKDIIFGIAFSSCQEYLISCSHDYSIRLWKTEEFTQIERHANDNIVPLAEVSTGKDESSVRKIIFVRHNGRDYYVAGTRHGHLILGERCGNELIHLFTIKDIQTDWILDIATFQQGTTTFLVTVSGDFTMCIWNLAEVLKNKWRSAPVFMAKYISSLLSVTINATDKKPATHVYIGSYDGNIIAKEIKQLLTASLEYDGEKIKPTVWTRSDALVEIEKLPESFISDATNLNRLHINGLNQGRLLALDQRGSLNDDIVATALPKPGSMFVKVQAALNELNWKIRDSLVNTIADERVSLNSLMPFLDKAGAYIGQFYSEKANIESISANINDQTEKLALIEIYQCLTSVKITMASALMILYWLDDTTWRESREIKLDQSLRTQLLQKIDSKQIVLTKRSKARVIFEETVEHTKDALEAYFTANNPENILRVTYEDYAFNPKLHLICDFLAGEETDRQVPSESTTLKAAGINNLWAEMSNNFWTGNSRIAKTYFDSFVNKIYRCCHDTHIFLINEIVSFIVKSLASDPKKTITYLDLATGFNGTIAHGVYQKLTPKQRKRVTFMASDSSPKIVSVLRDFFQTNNIDILVQTQDLLTIEGIENTSLDIISQNLGAHHLSKDHQGRMYRRFVELLKPGGLLATGDVSKQQIKILAGLPDDIGAPEHPYDCRKLALSELKPLAGGSFPELRNDEGFYTCQIYLVEK